MRLFKKIFHNSIVNVTPLIMIWAAIDAFGVLHGLGACAAFFMLEESIDNLAIASKVRSLDE